MEAINEAASFLYSVPITPLASGSARNPKPQKT